MVSEGRAERLRHRDLAHPRPRLRVLAARHRVPAVLDREVGGALAVQAVQVGDAERLQLAAAQASEHRRRPQRPVRVDGRLLLLALVLGVGVERVEQLERRLRGDDALARTGSLWQVEPVGRVREHLAAVTAVERLQGHEDAAHPGAAIPVVAIWANSDADMRGSGV